jgi:hypothetical protein
MAINFSPSNIVVVKSSYLATLSAALQGASDPAQQDTLNALSIISQVSSTVLATGSQL